MLADHGLELRVVEDKPVKARKRYRLGVRDLDDEIGGDGRADEPPCSR